jgi:hypothetical protein
LARTPIKSSTSAAETRPSTRPATASAADRNAAGDAARARDLIAAGRAEAEQLGMAREIVRFERLTARLSA